MRQIVPEQNLVYLDANDSYTVDCSELVADNIAYVGEDQSGLWIEREPFEGRVRDFDPALVNTLFSQAEALRNTPETPEQAKVRRKSEVDSLRDDKIGAGFLYGFPDSPGTIQLRTQRDISNVQGVASAGQVLAATGDTATTINFRDSEDQTHALTGAQLTQMGLAVAGFISNHYGAAWAHKDALSGFTTVSAINTYNIETGWPQ